MAMDGDDKLAAPGKSYQGGVSETWETQEEANYDKAMKWLMVNLLLNGEVNNIQYVNPYPKSSRILIKIL